MNPRNVEALEQLVMMVCNRHDSEDWRAIAEDLIVTGGVLVPSALTEQDEIYLAATNWKAIGNDLPRALERIAKGTG